MLHFVSGDLLADHYDIFCHQVNCMATMGDGLAAQIKKIYPEVTGKYYLFCFDHKDDIDSMLGRVLYVKTRDNKWCANMFAQKDYGRDKRYTDYKAFDSCLEHLKNKLKISDKNLTVGFPDHIGCGLAGGDWNIILEKLQKFAEQVEQEVYIVKKE